MEKSDEILKILERFTQLRQKEIPKELENYLQYVADTGDTIFNWATVKYLFREKVLNVINNFNGDSQRLEEIPDYPNVDPFKYESMKFLLLERLDLFNAAPFTVQRLCKLLTNPRKQYSRLDKFMRALGRSILVVSTINPGRRRTKSEDENSMDNGDVSLAVNIDGNEAISVHNKNKRNGSGEKVVRGSHNASCTHSEDGPDRTKAKKAKLAYDDNKGRDDDVDREAIDSKSEAHQADVEVSSSDTVKLIEEATKLQKTEEPVTTPKEAPVIEEPDEAKKDDGEEDESSEPAGQGAEGIIDGRK